jgi:hypothetical protein
VIVLYNSAVCGLIAWPSLVIDGFCALACLWFVHGVELGVPRKAYLRFCT